jgi:LDH2 family malate/lactate/ureidoglycolate dehydrogenase
MVGDAMSTHGSIPYDPGKGVGFAMVCDLTAGIITDAWNDKLQATIKRH